MLLHYLDPDNPTEAQTVVKFSKQGLFQNQFAEFTMLHKPDLLSVLDLLSKPDLLSALDLLSKPDLLSAINLLSTINLLLTLDLLSTLGQERNLFTNPLKGLRLFHL